MNVLVTGATGFIGKHLIKKLTSLNFNVYISNTKVANLKNEKNLRIYDDIKFDYIYHLAALTKIEKHGTNNNGNQWFDNTLISMNIIRYWQHKQPQAKLICIGSSSCYAPNVEMTEKNYFEGIPEERFLGYSYSKRELLRAIEMIGEQHNLKWLYLIPSTVYGPNFQLNDNRYIVDIIRKCYDAKLNDSDFTIWGSGNQERELLFIDDAINLFINLRNHDNQVINIGNGMCYKINFIVQNVCNLLEYNYELVKRDLTIPEGMGKKSIQVQKLRSFQPDFQFTSLHDGLQKTIDYYKRTV